MNIFFIFTKDNEVISFTSKDKLVKVLDNIIKIHSTLDYKLFNDISDKIEHITIELDINITKINLDIGGTILWLNQLFQQWKQTKRIKI